MIVTMSQSRNTIDEMGVLDISLTHNREEVINQFCCSRPSTSASYSHSCDSSHSSLMQIWRQMRNGVVCYFAKVICCHNYLFQKKRPFLLTISVSVLLAVPNTQMSRIVLFAFSIKCNYRMNETTKHSKQTATTTITATLYLLVSICT